jgi:hypothetical protein
MTEIEIIDDFLEPSDLNESTVLLLILIFV